MGRRVRRRRRRRSISTQTTILRRSDPRLVLVSSAARSLVRSHPRVRSSLVPRVQVAAELDTSPADVKLIFKGRFLKDSMPIESVAGLEDGAVVHAMCSSAAAKPVSSPAAAENDDADESDDNKNDNDNDDNPQRPSSSAVETMLRNMVGTDNPEMLREMNAMLTDPENRRRILASMADPQMRLEYMRSMDRQLSNIESMPGGFAALASMMGQIDGTPDAGVDADEGARSGRQQGGEGAAGNNPFERLFVNYRSVGEHAGPMPNPWVSGSERGTTTAGRTTTAGGTTPPGMLPMADLQEMTSRLASGNMSQEEILEAGSRLASQMEALLGSLPPEQLAEVTSLAERLAGGGDLSMFSGAQREMMEGLLSAMHDGGDGGDGGDAGRLGTEFMIAAGLRGRAGGQQQGQQQPRRQQRPPLSEEELAEKNQQLRAMGFYDEDANRRALQTAHGNVHAAVDRLLSSGGAFGGFA